MLKIAAVTKLTRNLCLAGVIPGLAWKYRETDDTTSKSRYLTFEAVQKYIPGFVVAFVSVSLLRSLGDLTLENYGGAFGLLSKDNFSAAIKFIGSDAAGVALTVAMASVGLSTNLAALRGVGVRPFAVGFVGCAAVGSAGLGSIKMLSLAGLV